MGVRVRIRADKEVNGGGRELGGGSGRELDKDCKME